ncbi:hypothetical protein HYX05_05275 [Candidatus Woesearchaeota archaeon]|nr:hypothetical protein [Candidatus Woesearchaeota archaeon]
MAKLEGKVIKEMLTRKIPINVGGLPEVKLGEYELGHIPFTSMETLAEIERSIEKDPRSEGKSRKLLKVNVTDWGRFEPEAGGLYVEGLKRVAQDVAGFLFDFLAKDYFPVHPPVYVMPRNISEVEFSGLGKPIAYLIAGLKRSLRAQHLVQGGGKKPVKVNSSLDSPLDFMVNKATTNLGDNQFAISESAPNYAFLASTCRPLEFIYSVIYIALQRGFGKYTIENLNRSIKQSRQVTQQVVSGLMVEYTRLEKIAAMSVSILATEAYAAQRGIPLSSDEIEAFHKKHEEGPGSKEVKLLTAYLIENGKNPGRSVQHGLLLYIRSPLVLQEMLK